MSRTVGIVVARMGSSRVPGKAMIDLCGKPVIAHIIQAAREARELSEVCLATSTLPSDDVLAQTAGAIGARVFRGDPERVLDRVHGAAREFRADVIVDIGGDCPFIDAAVLDEAVREFRRTDVDYLCNYEPPTFPEGLDVNILKFEAVDRAFARAVAPSQRIHPFSYLTRHRDEFRIGNFTMTPDLSEYHWSLDFPEDVEFVRAVYEKIYAGRPLGLREVRALVESDPTVGELNRKLMRPKVLHAFWNSPGIIRDMHDDIVALVAMARETNDRERAAPFYKEIVAVADELRRQAEFSREPQ